MSVSPNAETVTNLYLYGQSTAPTGQLPSDIAQHMAGSKDVDKQAYMTTGAGRFAIGTQFNLINQFFTQDSNLLPAGTYTKAQIADHFGLTGYGLTLNQRNFQDGIDDYADRSYVFGTGKFKLDDNAIFVVGANGVRTIQNYAIIPDGNENFDFVSNDWFNKLLNPLAKEVIDPNNIGKTELDHIGWTETVQT